MKHPSIFSIGTAIAVAALGVIAVTPAASAAGGQDTASPPLHPRRPPPPRMVLANYL
jgi:hypothetical protein